MDAKPNAARVDGDERTATIQLLPFFFSLFKETRQHVIPSEARGTRA
jgi:hypothetical protein